MFLYSFMRSLYRVITMLVTLVVMAHGAMAQEVVLRADFTTLFDNMEYAGMRYPDSKTLFSARLTPKVGVRWAEHNELYLGADLVQDFGHDSKFLSDGDVQIYYTYKVPRVKLFAGIFPRSEMRGLDSPLFFDREYRYYHNRIGGVLARYEADDAGSFVEFAMDYTGMRDFDTREAFMIMSAAKWRLSFVKLGYDLMVGHYAKDYNPATIDGVVDNILLTPYVGVDVDFSPLHLDVKLSYVQSLQRDRIVENEWEAPCGGEVYLAISGWGATLSNRTYIGRAPYTYYNRYGAELYHGTQHYASGEGIYNIITASYGRRFFSDTVGVSCGITAEYDGVAWGTRQWLMVDVALDYGISLKRNRE